MHSLPVHINPFFFLTLSGRPPLSLICAPCEHVHLFLPERRRDARCLGLIVPNSPFHLSYLFRALSVNLNPTNKNDTSKTHCSDTFSAQASFFRLFFHLYTSLSLSIYIYMYIYIDTLSFAFCFYLFLFVLFSICQHGFCYSALYAALVPLFRVSLLLVFFSLFACTQEERIVFEKRKRVW